MTNFVNTDTCLSPNVKKMFDSSFPIDHSAINSSYFESDVLKINFDKILHHFVNSSNEDCILSLMPAFQSIHLHFNKYLESVPNAQDRIEERTVWTSHPTLVKISSKLYHLDTINKTNDAVIQNLLVLTSVLERSLGNILITSGKVKHVPALLRDLLCEAELELTLGPGCVRMMKLLVGCPRTLNLRNIVWHGFAFPGEIHPMFVTMILLLLTSIGERLKSSQLRLNKRIPTSDWRLGELIQFPRVSPIHQFKKRDLEKMMAGSEIFFKRNIPPFLRIFSLMSGGQPGAAIVLLLPMMETMMRYREN